jgi:hypothetical protein
VTIPALAGAMISSVAKHPVKSLFCPFHDYRLVGKFINIIINQMIMKIVRVQYTTSPEFSPINQANITAIVKELKALNHPGIKYSCWLLPNGKTFMHFDQFENEEAHEVLTSLASFKKFDAELWASGLEVEPVLELLSPVASTAEFWE